MTKEKIPSEHWEQVQFVSKFRKKYRPVKVFAIPNGGKRDKITAQKLKAEGVLSGVPDLFIPEWRTWVEMKKVKDSYLSEEQKYMRDYLEDECGDDYIVGYGWEDAMEKISFLENERNFTGLQ